MNLIYFFILCSENICSTIETDNVLQGEAENALHFAIKQIDVKIILSLNSQNYFPLLGSWYNGENLIFLQQFYINDEEISMWLSQKFADQNVLKHFLSNLKNQVFEFKTDKVLLCKNIINLNCKVELIRKEFLEKIMIEYANDIAPIDASNKEVLVQEFDKVMIKIVNCGLTYKINFGQKLTEIMLGINLNKPVVQETNE